MPYLLREDLRDLARGSDLPVQVCGQCQTDPCEVPQGVDQGEGLRHVRDMPQHVQIAVDRVGFRERLYKVS